MKSKVRACPVKIRVRLQIATSITSVFMSCFVSKVGTWTTEFWIQLCMKYPLHSFLSHVYMCALVVCGGNDMFMHVCMYVWICVYCMWRPEVDISSLSCLCSNLLIEEESLNKPRASSLATTTWHLYGRLGSEFQSLHLHSNYFVHWAIAPVPLHYLFYPYGKEH